MRKSLSKLTVIVLVTVFVAVLLSGCRTTPPADFNGSAFHGHGVDRQEYMNNLETAKVR